MRRQSLFVGCFATMVCVAVLMGCPEGKNPGETTAGVTTFARSFGGEWQEGEATAVETEDGGILIVVGRVLDWIEREGGLLVRRLDASGADEWESRLNPAPYGGPVDDVLHEVAAGDYRIAGMAV